MGLRGRRVHMIEEMTEAVISFQRVVPGARERLVQITGKVIQSCHIKLVYIKNKLLQSGKTAI